MLCVASVLLPGSRLSGSSLESLPVPSISGRDRHTSKKQGCGQILDVPTRLATRDHYGYDIVEDN